MGEKKKHFSNQVRRRLQVGTWFHGTFLGAQDTDAGDIYQDVCSKKYMESTHVLP